MRGWVNTTTLGVDCANYLHYLCFISFIKDQQIMKHVSIVIPQGPIILSSVIGTYKVFAFVNQYMEARGKNPPFDIHLVGLSKETELYDGLFAIRPDSMVSDIQKTALIMIP